jgi:hypothetical protein
LFVLVFHQLTFRCGPAFRVRLGHYRLQLSHDPFALRAIDPGPVQVPFHLRSEINPVPVLFLVSVPDCAQIADVFLPRPRFGSDRPDEDGRLDVPTTPHVQPKSHEDEDRPIDAAARQVRSARF